ncbi:ABC transporter permease [Ruminiclostridium cellobioparum]|uniref:ABC transporter permease n=1 Tax=Ruminiclostridium cellobioparum TaxID=29355 RepID=UPI0028AB9C2A|nr:ABC transporter permease subunit [Ruminiclostridium cellobioparum]
MIGIIIAFKDYSITSGFTGFFTSNWIGLKYFKEFVTDYRFGELVRNTLVISTLKMIFAFPVPILLALMISEAGNKGFKRVIQTASYLPNFISWVLVYGISTALFSESSGVINQLLISLGFIDKGIPFLTAPGNFWGMSLALSVWKSSGWWAIIFLAAISGIDSSLYEAAMCDGAGRLKRIWHVTLPGIKPAVITVLILSVGSFLGGGMVGSNFEQSILMGNNVNNSTSEIIQTYAFKMGMAQGRFSYATAVDLIQSVISIILIIVSNRIAKKVSDEGLF